jgi:hypothetical protein
MTASFVSAGPGRADLVGALRLGGLLLVAVSARELGTAAGPPHEKPLLLAGLVCGAAAVIAVSAVGFRHRRRGAARRVTAPKRRAWSLRAVGSGPVERDDALGPNPPARGRTGGRDEAPAGRAEQTRVTRTATRPENDVGFLR